MNLRRAAASDPALFPYLLELAWADSGGDGKAVRAAVDPQTTELRLELTQFLIEHGDANEAMSVFLALGEVNAAARGNIVAALLKAKQFVLARDIRLGERTGTKNENAIDNGDFEQRVGDDDSGFGWHLGREREAVRLSLDDDQPYSGANSLHVVYKGNSNPTSHTISQLIVVAPNTRYRLSFMARSKELVTAGLPVVTIADANSDAAYVLAQSESITGNTSEWKKYVVELATTNKTGAVIISLQRRVCAVSQCPIFGDIWLDNFALQKL